MSSKDPRLAWAENATHRSAITDQPFRTKLVGDDLKAFEIPATDIVESIFIAVLEESFHSS